MPSFNTASGIYVLQQRVWKAAPQTGLKRQIGKPHRIFLYFAKLYMNAHLSINSEYAVTPAFMRPSAFTQKLENLVSNFPLL